MKKIFNLRNILISIFIISFLLLLFVFIKNENVNKKESNLINDYKFSSSEKYKDAEIITNDKLKSNHCIDNICISNLIIYQAKSYCNIEMNITNKGKFKASGYLKLVFKDQEMTVKYNNLESKATRNYTIHLNENKLNDMSDFKVRKLTKDELKNIKSKK